METPVYKVFDIETTGTDTKSDKIIQICLLSQKNGAINASTKLVLPKEKNASLLENKSAYLTLEENVFIKKINPEAEKVHGISLEKLLDEKAPSFEELSQNGNVGKFLSSGYVMTYSGMYFDRVIFEREYRVIDQKYQISPMFIDVYLLYLHFNPESEFVIEDMYEPYKDSNYSDLNMAVLNDLVYIHKLTHYDILTNSSGSLESTLFKLYKKYNSKDNKLSTVYKRLFDEELEGEHDAEADARATLRIYFKLKETYGFTDDQAVSISTDFQYVRPERLPNTKMIDKVPCMAVGKHNGTPLHLIDDSYIKWMEGTGTFDRYFTGYIKFLKSQNNG